MKILKAFFLIREHQIHLATENLFFRLGQIIAQHHFSSLEIADFPTNQREIQKTCYIEVTCYQVHISEAKLTAITVYSNQEIVLTVWLTAIDHCPWRNNLNNLSFNNPNRLLRIFHLFSNSYLIALFNQDIDILLGRMIGNTRHRNRIVGILVATR